MTYTLYGNPKTRAFRVVWMLEELHAPYELVPAAPQSDTVRAVHAAGKVPVLVVDGTAISDSSSILTYLADRHHAFTAPAGTLARARQDAWLFRVLDEVDSVLWTAARHSFVLPEAERVEAVKASCRTEVARNLARIAKDMPEPYLTGDTVTLPDMVLCHCCMWAASAKVPDAPETLQAYVTRLQDRPGFQAAMTRRAAA